MPDLRLLQPGMSGAGCDYVLKKYHLPNRQVVFFMDLRGIEPLSESLFPVLLLS